MAISNYWGVWVDDNGDPDRIKRGMYALDIKMEEVGVVKDFFYGLQNVGGSVAIKGFITFFDKMDVDSVMTILPEFNVSPLMTYREAIDIRGFLCVHCLFTKFGIRHFPPQEDKIKIYVEWHYEEYEHDGNEQNMLPAQ